MMTDGGFSFVGEAPHEEPHEELQVRSYHNGRNVSAD